MKNRIVKKSFIMCTIIMMLSVPQIFASQEQNLGLVPQIEKASDRIVKKASEELQEALKDVLSNVNGTIGELNVVIQKAEEGVDKIIKTFDEALEKNIKLVSKEISKLPAETIGGLISSGIIGCLKPAMLCARRIEDHIDEARETDPKKLKKMKEEFWKKEKKFANTYLLYEITEDDTPKKREWKEKFAKGIGSVSSETGIIEVNNVDLYADVNMIGFSKNILFASCSYVWKNSVAGAFGKDGWLTGQQALNCYRKKKKSE